MTEEKIALTSFLPQGFSPRSTCHSLTFPLTEDFSQEIKVAGLTLPSSLLHATPHRQQEFLSGRLCALKALNEKGYMGPPLLGIDSNGAPVWPPGWIGSITHSKGFVAAAIASRTELSGIGIDSEPIMSEQTAQKIFKRILTGSELERPLNPEWVTLVFSAKESIYKCLRPQAGNYFGFSDAEIISVDETRGIFSFKLNRDIGGPFKKDWVSGGHFSGLSHWVHTAVELREV